MSTKSYDIAIIGAGIVGAACAAEAAAEGMRVVVLEGGIIGGGATAAGMGQVVVLDDSEAQFALTRYSQELWQRLAADLPRDVEYSACGTVWVAADDEEMAEAERKANYYRSRRVPAEILDARALIDAEPNLRPGLAGGLLVPEDPVIYPPRAAQFLVERAKQAGAEIRSGLQVSRVEDEALLMADGTRVAAQIIVNAAGAEAPALTPGLPIQKRKGHLVITERYPGFIRHQVAELGYLKSAHSTTADSVAFNVQPRITGQILIGSSRQYGAEDTAVDPLILSQMLSRATQYLPGLSALTSIRIWTGFRAATPDKLPLIGPCPGYDHLYLATGHEGLGITTSLATARLLVDQLAGRVPAIPFDPYLPSRMSKQTAHELAHE